MAAKPKTNKPMTKSAIAAHLAETVGYSKKQALQTLEEIATLAYKEAKNTFTLPGLGKLILQDRAARVGRNPQTGEPVQIPAKKVVKFRVAKAAKDEILGPAAAKPAPKAAPKKAPAKK